MRAKRFTAAALLAALPLPSLAVPTDYFIQPIIYYGSGGVINGLEVNGAVSDTQSYYNSPAGAEARVDLVDGTLKGYASADQGLPSVFVQPRFGDTVTFHSVDRHTVDFKLAVDGSIESDPITPNLNSTQQVSSDAYFAVYDVSAGADETNWACPWFSCSTITPPTAAPLASDRYTVNFDNHATMVDQVLNHVLTASVDVGAGAQSLMVFGNLTLIANRNTNPGTTTLDFLNTAAFGFDLDPGVTFDSPYGSQSFLQNSVNVGIRSPVPSQVPEPATGWLLIGGLGGLALRKLRRS